MNVVQHEPYLSNECRSFVKYLINNYKRFDTHTHIYIYIYIYNIYIYIYIYIYIHISK